MKTRRKIRKVITQHSIGESKNDFAYWQTQPPAVRIAALEKNSPRIPSVEVRCSVKISKSLSSR